MLYCTVLKHGIGLKQPLTLRHWLPSRTSGTHGLPRNQEALQKEGSAVGHVRCVCVPHEPYGDAKLTQLLVAGGIRAAKRQEEREAHEAYSKLS